MTALPTHSELHIAHLRTGLVGISPVVGAALVEACNAYLADLNHPNALILTIGGGYQRSYLVHWEPETVTDQVVRSWKDVQDALEDAAVCVACLLIRELTEYTIIERSRKGTGFDYWLGRDVEEPLFPPRGRLEISGIRKGTDNDIRQRVKEKLKQSDPTDHLGLPAFAVVVEFTRPEAHVVPK